MKAHLQKLTRACALVGRFVENVVFVVGLMTIYGYIQQNHPVAWRIGAIMFCTIAGLAFLWRVVIVPFREGYRGGDSAGAANA